VRATMGIGAGSTLFPGRVRQSYMAHSSSCLHDFAAEPPAHDRLVSGHDLFRRRGLSRLYRRKLRRPQFNTSGDRGHLRDDGWGPGFFPLVRRERHFPRSRHVRVCAPDRAGQGRQLGRPALRGRLDARGLRRARISDSVRSFMSLAFENHRTGIEAQRGETTTARASRNAR